MARSLLKHVPKLFGRDRRELFGALQSSIALLGGFFQDGHLLGGGAVFSLGVVRRLDIDLAQRHDVGAADDTDILAPSRSGEPTSQVLLGIGNCERLHRVFISLLYRLVKSYDRLTPVQQFNGSKVQRQIRNGNFHVLAGIKAEGLLTIPVGVSSFILQLRPVFLPKSVLEQWNIGTLNGAYRREAAE